MISQSELQELFNDVKEIRRAVVGETKWGEKGLIKRVESIESWKNNINLKVAWTSGLVVGAIECAKYGLELLKHKP